MKRIILSILVCILLNCTQGFAQQVYVDVLPTPDALSLYKNRVWSGTFQLVWEDFVNSTETFNKEHLILINKLNKNNLKPADLPEQDYYKTFGKVTPSLKNTLDTDCMQKLHTLAGLPKDIDAGENLNKQFFYSKLKKDFNFETEFSNLKSGYFGVNGGKKVKYFGIDANSTLPQRNNVRILHYNNSNDYAIKLLTDSNDEIILYKNAEDMNFDELYQSLKNKSYEYEEGTYLTSRDEVKIPCISFYITHSFDKLYNNVLNFENIKTPNSIIVENIDFKLRNKKLNKEKEPILVPKMSIYYPDTTPQRNFYFDKTFVLFLKDKSSEKPYFALRVADTKAIDNYTEK